MSVRFFYMDESYDREKFCLSAIAIRHSHWKEAFDEVKSHRARLKADYGIFLRTELHATDFVHGRGKIGDRAVTKWERGRIFLDTLKLVARLPEVMLFNVCLPNKGISNTQMVAWDRMINRIERTMREMETRELPLRTELSEVVKSNASTEDLPTPISPDIAERIETRLRDYHARAFIIADEGREREITTAIRRMHVFNPVPSRYGGWASGNRTQNIPTVRIIEDPVFKPSHRSHFLQLADFAAFALLKREVAPTPTVGRYNIHKMFDEALAGICFRLASPRDPLGIVRA
ncbi:MAG: DUF3800 domain-containing protein [Thermoguttaceae bacterium]|jgi:hypothetical protein